MHQISYPVDALAVAKRYKPVVHSITVCLFSDGQGLKNNNSVISNQNTLSIRPPQL